MIYEGVNFFPSAVKKMDKDSFIESHLPYFWRDREEETRRKMLGQVHDLICKNPKTKKNKQ